MLRRVIFVLVLACALQTFSLGIALQSEAKDLIDVLGRGFVFQGQDGGFFGVRPRELESTVDFSRAGKAVAPAFSAAIAQAITQDFPFASVAPAFIYRLDPAVDVWKRFTGVPGPLFNERALALGKGRLNFGIGYSFIDYSTVNGNSLDNLTSPGLITDIPNEPDTVVGQLPTGETLLAIPYVLSQIRTRIDLNAHVAAAVLRYGIADQWDISLVLPIVNTFLRVRNEAVRKADLAAFIAEGGPEIVRLVDPTGNTIDPDQPEGRVRLFRFAKSQRPSALLGKATGSATGIGDITLRSKYQFWQSGFGGGAFGLNLQLPTGERRNFHGTGQTHLMTFLYLSQIFWERFEPHLNLGVDFNADDVDRSSILYTLGGALRISEKLGVMVDFLGRSEFEEIPVRVEQEDKVTGGVLGRRLNSCSYEEPCRVVKEIQFPAVPIRMKRNDIVNFTFGLRYAIGTAGSIFFGGIVPLNDDGFRADFIPSCGLEYTF